MPPSFVSVFPVSDDEFNNGRDNDDNEEFDEERSNEIHAESERMLSSGETERLIAEAKQTQAKARALGRHDIVEKAQAVIDNLKSKHLTLKEKHAFADEKIDDLKAKREGLRTAQERLDEATEHLRKIEERDEDDREEG